jgi:hypothetical protein
MRTDIHRPSATEFDPQDYNLWDVFDLEDEWQRKYKMEQVNLLLAQGKKFASHQHSGQCGHCGAHIRYAALMIHEPTNTMIYVGEQCLGNRFELSKAQFDKLRKMAALNHDRVRKSERIAALIDSDPWLAELTYLNNGGLVDTSDFLTSIGHSLVDRGELTDRQYDSVSLALRRQVEKLAEWARRDAQRAEDDAQAQDAPSGRVHVTGEILSTKYVENAYGGSLKMLVRTSDGYKVWTTVPRDLYGINTPGKPDIDELKGSTVELTVTLTPSDDDPKFAFGKRPSNAVLV